LLGLGGGWAFGAISPDERAALGAEQHLERTGVKTFSSSGLVRRARQPGKRRLKLLATEPIVTLTRTAWTTSTAVAPKAMPNEAEA
jgi:hypothetical protein